MSARAPGSTPAEIATRYVDIWNESDPARRRSLIERSFARHACYQDPLMQSDGHDGLNAMIAAAQEQFAGLRFSVAGKPDGHHDVVRFSWALGVSSAGNADHATDAEPLAIGTDIAVLGADGRIERVTGFIDKMPS